MKPIFSQLCYEGSSSQYEDFFLCIIFLQKAQRHIAGGDELILRAVQVKRIMEFFHIIQPAFCGIVGNVISPATDVVDIADQIRTAFVQGIAHGDRSVDVEQKKLFIFQTRQFSGIAVPMVRVKSIHNGPHF